jgi:hypothetical protein
VRSFIFTLCTAAALAACIEPMPDGVDPEDGAGFEGVDEDNDPDTVMDDGKSDLPRYAIPTDLPELVNPEIIVSLDGLSVHMFDRATGFSEVYPAGVGVKNSRGNSITPRGHFKTHHDTNDTWFYVARRTNPEYFGGFPFLRLNAKNSAGANTYALHGPITETLIRGYVSHGCIRMRPADVIRIFWIMKKHPSAPVTIQTEVEKDANGKKVDVGMTPALYPVGAAIPYGASVGPRPF